MDCFKILSKHGDIDAKANQILKCELGDYWDEKTHEEIRLNPRQCGFSSKYLSTETRTSRSIRLARCLLLKRVARTSSTWSSPFILI